MDKLSPEIIACKDAYLKGLKVSDVDIALASYSVLDEYRWKPYPTPPNIVEEYFKKPAEVKRAMNKNPEKVLVFWQDPEVVKFFDGKQRIKNLNDRNKDWLYWMKKTLEEPHPDKTVAIDLKLHQFSDEHQKSLGAVDQPRWDE